MTKNKADRSYASGGKLFGFCGEQDEKTKIKPARLIPVGNAVYRIELKLLG